jgi:uncharacterized protein YwqG
MAMSPEKLETVKKKGLFSKLFGGKAVDDKPVSELPENFPITTDELRKIVDKLDSVTKKPVVWFDTGAKVSDVKSDSSVLGGFPPYVGEIPVDKNRKQLRFLIQINCKHISSLSDFPHDGIIQLWLDRNVSVDNGGYKVLYFKDTKGESKIGELDKSIYGNGNEWVCIDSNYNDTNDQFLLSFKTGVNYLASFAWNDIDNYEELFAKCWNEIITDESKHITADDVYDLIDKIPKTFNAHFARKGDYNQYGNKLGGYPGFTQSDPRRDDGWTSDNSVLLLQLDSKGPLMWGDCGSAQVFIKKDDLKSLNFNNVLFDWACY